MKIETPHSDNSTTSSFFSTTSSTTSTTERWDITDSKIVNFVKKNQGCINPQLCLEGNAQSLFKSTLSGLISRDFLETENLAMTSIETPKGKAILYLLTDKSKPLVISDGSRLDSISSLPQKKLVVAWMHHTKSQPPLPLEKACNSLGCSLKWLGRSPFVFDGNRGFA